jgi:hypothetical protein
MVEIPVERKSSLKWLWLLLALLLLGLLLWWALDDNDAEVAGVAPATAVEESVEPGAAMAPAAGADTTATDPAGPAAQGAGASIAAILRNPAAYVGRNDFAAEVQVPEVPTDRGFWVEHEGARMFALIIDGPREDPVDINPGQRLRVTEGMLRDNGSVGQLPGQPLDADTRRILADQQIFLVVHEDNIEILSRPGA